MRLLLLRDSHGETAKLGFQALDLEPRCFALVAIHLRGSRTCQTPGGAVHNRRRHLQIAQQFRGRRRRCFRFRLPLRFEEQCGFLEQALPDRR
jgi:hypothetical protein